MTQIRIAHDSNLRFLPMVYFLPEDKIAKCPTLWQLPRRVREVMYSEAMMAIVNSDQFLNEIMDAAAALAFPHFGFRGWKEHYTGYSPVWQLSYAVHGWIQGLEQEIGWNLQALMHIHSSKDIEFFQPEFIKEVMGRIVKRTIKEQGWQPFLDAVREMPCEEDFEPWNTWVRKDFRRKWYHTRAKWVQTVSLEICIEDESNGIYQLPNASIGFENDLAEQDYFEKFKESLSKNDLVILSLRSEGLTYEEIAKKLGYKNHSGVLKRMRAIAKAFTEYENLYG